MLTKTFAKVASSRLITKRGLATQVPMSLLEKDKFINYSKMEDNLKVVRDRYVMIKQITTAIDFS
jgi:hypothetical protein